MKDGAATPAPTTDAAWLDVLEGIERPKVFTDARTGSQYRVHADAILAGHEDWVSSVRGGSPVLVSRR